MGNLDSMSVPPVPVRPRILLVEDDAAVRHALQLLLIAKGYDVRAYAHASGLADNPEALRAVCLVADLVLPGDNAILLLKQLKGAGWSGPAILISGQLTDEWKAQALAEGYDAVLSKPIADTVLTDLIARLYAARSEVGGAVDGGGESEPPPAA